MGRELVTRETIQLNPPKADHPRSASTQEAPNLSISFSIRSNGSNAAAQRRQGLSLVLRDKTNKAERSPAFITDSRKTTIPWLWEFLVHLNRGTTFHAAAKAQRSLHLTA